MSAKSDIERFVRNLQRGVGQTVSKANMRLIGERAIELIVARTQRGFGVKQTGGNENPLKPLSDKYIEYRRRSRNKLDPTTSAQKSNLTFTGQLLRSMTIKLATNRQVKVGPNSKRRKGGLTNEDLAEILSEQRPFNSISKREILELVEFVDKTLKIEIQRN